jgi:sterol desaturase/sphingolipid hydroxylase (fatty acid hydroxylase superfamily)
MTFDAWWPYDWPVALQTLLMILSADFLRYWLHRFSHEWPLLWRLHAVHHSPHKLYWVNVARFHPIEKALQYFFDAMPFIILGISEEVLALYFVFYSINGFFQHCNIKLRLGFLNYIVSGPELHRWHHSMIAKESNQNYGNNLIVWDLLFGTWYLPRNRQVDTLGLVNRDYPMPFVSQLKAPFIKGIEQG